MNKDKKRVVIHAGPGKTGTSAIQAWLVSNRDFLKKNNVFYPEYLLSEEKISSGHVREILTQEVNGNWKVDPKKIQKLLLCFEKSKYSVLLLSSEYFFHEIADIKKLIPAAEFIIYVRNPVELLESNYNQAVKRHSKIHRFIPPQKLDNYFWHYLNTVFNRIEHKDLHLRNYDRSLMVNGNIVSDLLSIIAINVDVNDKRINPSFTFQCLEFKRLLNYFGLKHLEPQLDSVLQGCDVGDKEYSLMSKEAFNTLNKESYQQMQKFINAHNQIELVPLYNLFKGAIQKPFIKQHVLLSDLLLISSYLLNAKPALHQEITLLLAQNPNMSIDNQLIYDAFGVVSSPIEKKQLLSPLLLKHINQFKVLPSKHGKICFELANYYEQNNDIENALIFAKGAHYFNPEHILFTVKLNQLIKMWNTLQRKGEPMPLWIRIKFFLREKLSHISFFTKA